MYTILVEMTWVVLFGSIDRAHFDHNQNKIQIFIFLHFVQVSMGECEFFQTPRTGGSCELI